MRPHENLIVWKRAVDFVIDIYRTTGSFPNDERYGLTSQIRRAAVSIPANIAEGAGRKYDKEFARFLSIAQGSSSELETELLIAKKLRYLTEDVYSDLRKELDSIGQMLIGLERMIEKRILKN